MNFPQCANCLLHGWKEVEDPDTLQRCKRCKAIKYCGRDCQTVHWLKVHHKHCKYFADPVKAERWDHKPEDCVICRQEAVAGMTQLMRPDNPYYFCIFQQMKKIPPDMLHPVPFPAAGDPGDLYEKSTIVLLQLLVKFRLTQPGVVDNCQDEFREVCADLVSNRIKIWMARKISPQPQLQRFTASPPDLSILDRKVKGSRLIPEPFQLWKIILLVEKLSAEVVITLKLNGLINPLTDIPAGFHADVLEGMSNLVEFLATANQVLDALARRVIPYQDVLAIICGGSLGKTCSFCPKKITIADVASLGVLTSPFVLFDFVHTTMYCCNSNNSCCQKAKSMKEGFSRSGAAMMAVKTERGDNQCDFCFKYPPMTEVHRCSKCLSVMYCSTDCRDKDFKIHKEVCKEDTEERKKKTGQSARRKEGRDALESLKEELNDLSLSGASKVVTKFKLKNPTKKSDK